MDKAVVRGDAKPVMDKLIAFLKANPQFNVVAASYCDSRASESYNIELSNRRSNAVKDYLSTNGIAVNRIKVSAYGEENLVNHCADNVGCDEAHQQLNRRTEFLITYKGKNVTALNCKEFN
ncbi:MAG: OmpA family protein [Pedobacter sp.]|nr:MAG: OmpA family protein [Pedobacter sp.]